MAIRNRSMALIDGGIGDSPATQSSFMNQQDFRNPAATGASAPATTKPAANPATGGTATGAPAVNLPATAGATNARTTLPAVAGATPAAVNVTATGSVVSGPGARNPQQNNTPAASQVPDLTSPGAGAPKGAGSNGAADRAAAVAAKQAQIVAAERYIKNMLAQGNSAAVAGAQSKLKQYQTELFALQTGYSQQDAAANMPATSGATPGAAGPTPTEQQLDAAIANLLNPEFIGFQGDRAAELRRLQNLRNQLFGFKDAAGNVSVGSVGRQQQSDLQARRRLAAQRAGAGMLQGGAYAGTERGLGTIQEADQAYAMQELLRPYQEQTASDRLQEFGLGYDPTGRNFNLLDFGNADNIMGGWSTGTYAGRRAAAAARNAAVQQLLQQGTTV
jgi:hypothetical protein